MQTIYTKYKNSIFLIAGLVGGLFAIFIIQFLFQKPTVTYANDFSGPELRPLTALEYTVATTLVQRPFISATLRDDSDREFPITTSWINNTLTITPQLPYELETQYTLTLSDIFRSFYTEDFTVIPLSEVNRTEEAVIAAVVEEAYAKKEREYFENNPWLSNLPIISNTYSIRWNSRDEEVLVRVISTNPVEREIIEKALKDAGINPNSFKITYENEDLILN